MNTERKRELASKYRTAVLGASQEETTHFYKQYLKTLHVERDERDRPSFHIFLAVRRRSRDNGYRADDDLLNGRINRKLYAQRLKKYCADVYAKELTRYELADIDTESEAWASLVRRVIIECVKEFDGIDPDDKDAVCTAMARTWHRFVQVVHKKYNLPTVRDMRKHVREESDIEKSVMDTNDFETRMTRQERVLLEAEIP